ncbi:MAG TPA: SpoIIE family protein phosphatase [Thermoleophilaceae bacterium]|nr:SpoIIE family protein phosphatase [Thermoleophilaceae bacterium]
MGMNGGRAPAGAPGSPQTILLIEDDAGDALLVREALEAAAPELELREAGSLAAALDQLPDGIACALLDLGLPDATGIDGVKRMRELAPDVAVVVLTGRDDEQLGIEALGAGAQDYLVKGNVEPEVLARALRYAIERRRAELSEHELIEARVQARENTRLERGLLPTALIGDPRLRLTADYRPGRRRALLGGDFYDAIELSDGAVHLMIGDVCGHGPDEAALGACLRAAWRALTLAGLPQQEVMATLHRMLPHERHEPDVFATLCTLEIAPDRRAADIRLAGHQAPILIDADGVSTVDVAAGAPPLGIFEQSEWPAQRQTLTGPWSLLLYTDGLVEGKIGAGHERLGEQRLVEMIERRLEATARWPDDARSLLDSLITEVEQRNGEPLTDDLAVLLLSSSGFDSSA